MQPVRKLPTLALFSVVVALAGCASGPSDTISLIPQQVSEETSKDGVFTQPIKWERTKPGCKGDCPTIQVDSLVFPGNPKLTQLVDHALAVMTGVSEDRVQPYTTIEEFEEYFWQTAAPRDQTVFSAKTRYRNKHLTVLELNSWQYFTGAAHGIAATQFLNWDNDAQRLLALDDVLQPGAQERFIAALRAAHAAWLEKNPDAQNDPQGYNRLWPFQPSDNYALTDAGVVVKYNSYEIAPYSHGQPELTIPYSQLGSILRPQYLPQ